MQDSLLLLAEWASAGIARHFSVMWVSGVITIRLEDRSHGEYRSVERWADAITIHECFPGSVPFMEIMTRGAINEISKPQQTPVLQPASGAAPPAEGLLLGSREQAGKPLFRS